MTMVVDLWAKKLQTLVAAAHNGEKPQDVVKTLAGVIKIELCEGEETPNQTVLNIAARTYCQLLSLHGLTDDNFKLLVNEASTYQNERNLQLLYAFVQVDNSINHRTVAEKCFRAFQLAVTTNDGTVLILLRLLNLLCKKSPHLCKDFELSLESIYHCLQGNQIGMREEILLLYGSYCKQSPQRAFQHFQFIIEFWPWTNRNKLYLLSIILSSHNLIDALHCTEQHSLTEFFAGLRLSLSYKRLLAASQCLVKALSNQNSKELLQLSATILINGSCKEVQNFHSQWFSRIEQKDEIFQLIQCKPEIVQFLENSNSCVESTENFRLILVFNMFSRQIFAVSRLHFFKISTELITNCFQLETEAQMLVFKFIVDNLCNFSIEDCLEFVLAFVQQHRSIDNPQHRNGILGRIPNIVNYISKMFSKHCAGDCTTLEASVTTFFRQLQVMIETDMASDLYQPKIFALKLFQILHKSIYAPNVTKNAKKCSVAQNQNLGHFLIEQQVFDPDQMSQKLIKQLNDPQGFDDALELIVAMLADLRLTNSEHCSLQCRQMCARSNVDECVLSSLYARVALQTNTEVVALDLFHFALKSLEESVEEFEKDPLQTCKNKNHLFGYINVINEVTSIASKEPRNQLHRIIALLERILNIILIKLNLYNIRNNIEASAADFHDMDESLQLLVQESAFDDSKECAEKCRKYLLMSFWLTLKACCDLATSIGCLLVATAEHSEPELVALSQCLQINVAVLTRCRHKGAIEAAGLSIGTLTKNITSCSAPTSRTYDLVQNCLELLFDTSQRISASRRGAGFSIMLLHVVKNEAQRNCRPLLKRALTNIFKHLQQRSTSNVVVNNCDRIEALSLHYLCVLVRDTELRDALAPSYSEIIMAAIAQIDHNEWTVCNAALQLMGALIPKIVGQSQANEFDTAVPWESCEVTYSEILCKLPKACDYIFEYCDKNCASSSATRSIILFLGCLAKVEHLRKSLNADDTDSVGHEQLQRFRELMWRLLRHGSEKVRQLAAICFVRAHDFRNDLPQMLTAVSQIVFSVRDENFFQGLLFALYSGITKLQHECVHTLEPSGLQGFMGKFRTHLADSFKLNKSFKLYTLVKLLDLLLLVGFNRESSIVTKLISIASTDPTSIGRDLWLERVAKVVAQ